MLAGLRRAVAGAIIARLCRKSWDDGAAAAVGEVLRMAHGLLLCTIADLIQFLAAARMR